MWCGVLYWSVLCCGVVCCAGVCCAECGVEYRGVTIDAPIDVMELSNRWNEWNRPAKPNRVSRLWLAGPFGHRLRCTVSLYRLPVTVEVSCV